MKRVAVAGGGVTGLCCALELLDAGHGVTLIDNDPDGLAASWGNAGHIAAEQVEPLASVKTLRSFPQRLFLRGGALALPPSGISAWLPFSLRLIAASRPARFRKGADALRALLGAAMPAWLDLAARVEAEDLVRQDGHLVAWMDGQAARKGTAAWIAGDTGSVEVSPATAGDLEVLGRLCGRPVGGAARFAGSGQIADLGALRLALRTAVEARGGEIVAGEAVVRGTGGKAQVEGVEADAVVVCAGVRSGGIMAGLGHKVPIVAERGYHIRAEAPLWPEDLPPVAFEERATIVTRFRDCVQAASFVEFSHADAPPDPRKWERLERHVAELGLPVKGPFRRWMGCRPTLPDYLPAIGRSQRLGNLFYAFGHQHLGLTLAPVTGGLIRALVTGEEPAMPVAPFDVERFA
ncbi:NAD(P)/FAD-dependent oxidoreductase [Novosphingobium beihaiensis]|uniref:FAD-binding oxidoreductase n=1 Tax=Novosphingobium beihaiensis TaxID=2930389 RepID=A0ABT0BL29_9SPHN|nr:FAD-binding oxidoreductase [Novosphingobium beihaiensis]MCJ2185766.1 FAD-binding oxidoreductase [Novosphingobium beihaiensis]